jgi:hypothetical protein
MDKVKLKEIIQSPKDYSNKDLIDCLEFLSTEHENLKNELMSKTYYLDEIQKTYETLLDVYKNRTKK